MIDNNSVNLTVLLPFNLSCEILGPELQRFAEVLFLKFVYTYNQLWREKEKWDKIMKERKRRKKQIQKSEFLLQNALC